MMSKHYRFIGNATRADVAGAAFINDIAESAILGECISIAAAWGELDEVTCDSLISSATIYEAVKRLTKD